MSIILAIKTFFRVLFDREFAGKVAGLDRQMTAASLALLVAMQREGRLIDFLLEDIDSFSDAQVGAAARSVHKNCRKVVQELVEVGPVRTEDEGARVRVEKDFDPSAIRLVGNVKGDPPFEGTLKHHGWRAQEVRIVTPPLGQDERVITPAEVEIR